MMPHWRKTKHSFGNLVSEISSLGNLVSEISSLGNLVSEISSLGNLVSEISSFGNLVSEISSLGNLVSEISSFGNLVSEISSLRHQINVISCCGSDIVVSLLWTVSLKLLSRNSQPQIYVMSSMSTMLDIAGRIASVQYVLEMAALLLEWT